MTAFPLGARVRNIRTGELGTIVKLTVPHAALNPDAVGCEYDCDEGNVWHTPPAKLELLIVEDGQ